MTGTIDLAGGNVTVSHISPCIVHFVVQNNMQATVALDRFSMRGPTKPKTVPNNRVSGEVNLEHLSGFGTHVYERTFSLLVLKSQLHSASVETLEPRYLNPVSTEVTLRPGDSIF